MKNLLLTTTFVALALGATAEAGNSNRCKNAQACCSPCQTTRWYKAKDGTYREMVPYMTALSRAEDADDMEPVLKKAQADLAAVNTQIETLTAEAAAMKAQMEAQLAELQKQLDAATQIAASQTERADKAEAAHKMCIEQVATLRDDAKKRDEELTSTKGELKTTSEERDSLKTARADLEKQVSELNSAKTAAEEAQKKAQEELEKMKQEAAEAKKAKIEEEEAAKKEGDAPEEGEEKPPEPATEPAPETPASDQ